MLAHLAASAGQSHERDKLARLLWCERTDGQARGNLRKALSRLRHALPDEAADILVTDTTVAALRPDWLEVDVLTFERLVGAGTPETL